MIGKFFEWLVGDRDGKEVSEVETALQSEAAESIDQDELEVDSPSSWLGIGFDGALATRVEGGEIGQPVFNMCQRFRDWVELGLTVKILTWRGGSEAGCREVQEWLEAHDLPVVEVTDQKDFGMVEFWSADVIQVIRNTGKPVGEAFLDGSDNRES